MADAENEIRRYFIKFTAQTYQEVANELSNIQTSQSNKSENLAGQINDKLTAVSRPENTCRVEEGSLTECYLANKKDPSLCKAAIQTYLACAEKGVIG